MDLNEIRQKILTGEDKPLYVHLGYFTLWYAAVELRLSALLAYVLNIRHRGNFELLTRGMDAKVKCERLRTACRLNKRPLGTNLNDRLAYFQERIIPIRNKVAHTLPIISADSKVICFSSLAKLPMKEHGLKQVGESPPSMPLLHFFEHSLWLNHFSDDLSQLAPKESLPEILEIKNPMSPLPTEFLEGRRRKDAHASADKPTQTEG